MQDISTGPVVLWQIELYAPAYPGPGKANQCRLDDVVVIDEMTLGDFVPRHLHPSSQFGQNHHFKLLVLDEYSIPFVVCFLVRDGFYYGIWIHNSA